MLVNCQCGCGEQIPKINKRNELARFKRGHCKPRLYDFRSNTERQRRYQAMTIMKIKLNKNICEVNNKDCKGRLETHHIDKNTHNNDISNLALLCITHHRLAEKRNLDINELKMLKLEYYISSGKRRYKK
jgi:hypothetical protein